MKTKSTPEAAQSIKVTLEGKTFELTKTEATALYNALKRELNITEPVQWLPPAPVVVDRPVYIERPFTTPSTPWDDPYRITCKTIESGSNICESAQMVNGHKNRIFNLTAG